LCTGGWPIPLLVGTTQYPNGTSRPGVNLYTDSMVALSAKTGKLLWYHQAFPHDLYDRDQVQAMLVPVGRSVDGSRLVAVSTGKGGYVLGLKPVTRRLLWKTAVGIHRNGDLPKLTGPTTVPPGTYGGVLTPPTRLRQPQAPMIRPRIPSHSGEVEVASTGGTLFVARLPCQAAGDHLLGRG
jgi:hypothetical protein